MYVFLFISNIIFNTPELDPHCFCFLPYQSDADLLFGGITIVSGIFGTLAGGYVLDKMQATISNAFKVNIPNKTMNLQLYHNA